MTIKSVKNLKFKDAFGIFEYTGKHLLGLYEEGKGFISFDGKSVYLPQGGRKALNSILKTGLAGDIHYINPIN